MAVTSGKRSDDLPTVPTVAESGYQGFEALTGFGIAGPAGMPKDGVMKLNAAFNQALQDRDVKERLAGQGLDVAGGTPERFGEHIRAETLRWGKVVKESGAKID